ncbi:MAG: 50S ribosomal protein L9 [Gemmatimonadetes bacterium]|nr:50S ribosomal protein L9 [Gemmatimonadota bacterium]NIR77109.1 50S ribosomal protein L9 [Gemmatimonadota bacterium]NIT85627.1 50S ribosomal protein L9 [Gemmatimonadota bacterium]NIU29459.1 50S ribosomal protein L9 [Gemmatimonadota bacterium]NIU34522.1 50S ribosomal protein L9 [Gemmatimonadota bacterium]
MKLILRETVEHLGEPGEIVDVKPGYARNYLLPQGLAETASEENIARLEEERRQAEERTRREYLEARRRASQLEGTILIFHARAGEEGKLFGSVTAADITERARERAGLDFALEKGQVRLDEPIKEVGAYKVPVKLHDDVEIEVQVRVERAED